MIGLCGAHRTGKSSLARAFAAKHGSVFVETGASAVFKELGYDPAVTYDFSTRLDIQEAILEYHDRLYAKHSHLSSAIADRTPLDFLGYTMGDATGVAVPEHEVGRFKQYVERCYEVTNKRFSTLLLVQPGISVVPAEGKASLNEAYIEHLNSLILGLSVDERVKAAHFYLPRHMTKMDDRIGALEFAVKRSMRRVEVERESLPMSAIH